MPQFLPQSHLLRQHVEYYWIVDERDALLGVQQPVHEFPSLAPELVLGIRGLLRYRYRGQTHATRRSVLFGYIDHGLTVYPAELRGMIVVKFKPRGLSSILPFLSISASDLIRRAVVPASEVFGAALAPFERHLCGLSHEAIAAELDAWLLLHLDPRRAGIAHDVFADLSPRMSVQDLAALTQTSYSTLTRHFKTDTGLTPKRFLVRHRFKHVLADLFRSGHADWFDYVARYGYHDQSHFIREVKRFSGFTPGQLLTLPYLSHHRPESARGDFIQ